MSILLIAASPGQKSRSAALLAAAAEQLQLLGLSTQTLRLRELPAQALLHADFQHEQIQAALESVRRAQVVVLATPIYKASYAGLLKTFLDLLPQDGLQGKTVWSLASGGSLAHLLALDYSLLPVLTSLGARQLVDGVYATDAQLSHTEQGPVVDEAIRRRLSAGAAQVFERVAQAQTGATQPPLAVATVAA